MDQDVKQDKKPLQAKLAHHDSKKSIIVQCHFLSSQANRPLQLETFNLGYLLAVLAGGFLGELALGSIEH